MATQINLKVNLMFSPRSKTLTHNYIILQIFKSKLSFQLAADFQFMMYKAMGLNLR